MSVSENKPMRNEKANTRVAIICAGLVFSMVGLAYASVPLYRIFCQVTGFGGTTQVSDGAGGTVLNREMTVAFDANVNRDLDWNFKPVQTKLTMKIGQESLAFYRATNTSKQTITGTAVFNVSPPLAGQYFNKVECFCFTEQTLKPGQTVDMPVTFFIDPEIANDKDLKKLKTITLSYTFYEKKAEEPNQIKTDKTADVSARQTGAANSSNVN